ncbi:MAG: DUF4349 domain-containing protein [Subdoligranulum variabile]|nr:DUF4349 domain-containing protein [Subdoligranulum variabile]
MKNRITRITAALAAAALLAGCGSISSKDGGYYTTEAAAQESYNYDSAAGGTDSSLMPANVAEAATDETAQKIIYNASLSMESTDFDAARETLMAAVEANDAWMESTSVYGTEKDHDRSADYTVRVPVDNYRAFLAAVGEAGSVRNVSENAENITSSYIDVQARLTALEAQRTRLNELADQAETTADLLEIESQLSDVQYQLENYTRQLRNMDQQVHLSGGGRNPDPDRRDLPRAHCRCVRRRLGRLRWIRAGAGHCAGLPVAGGADRSGRGVHPAQGLEKAAQEREAAQTRTDAPARRVPGEAE